MSSQSRKQRRAYEKFLKKTNPQAYKEWKSDSIARGKELHRQHLDNVLMQNQSIEITDEGATIDISDQLDNSEIIDYDKL